MIPLFIALTALAGFTLAYTLSKAWVAWTAIWLCVPLGMINLSIFAFALNGLGICQISPTIDTRCSAFGMDFGTNFDELQVLGYYLGFIAIPWFAFGLVCFAGIAALRVFKR